LLRPVLVILLALIPLCGKRERSEDLFRRGLGGESLFVLPVFWFSFFPALSGFTGACRPDVAPAFRRHL